jgi:large subunit ribosomal protein L9
MNVILLEKVRNLGELGEQVNVKAGFGRNYLIPQGLAITATADNIAQLETRRAELEKIAAEKLAVAEGRKASLEGLEIIIPHLAGEEGKLFGSIGTIEIAKFITDAGVEVSKAEVRLPEGALRNVGEFEVELALHSDVNAMVKITVVAEVA